MAEAGAGPRRGKAAPPTKKTGAGTLASRLAKLGLRSDADFLLHLPLRYEDETRITAVRDALPGVAAQFEVVVIDSEIIFRPRRQLVVRVHDADESLQAGDTLQLRFPNFYPSQQKALQAGMKLRVFGEVRPAYAGGVEMIHPRVTRIADGQPLPASLTPIYPTTAGLGQLTLRRLIERAFARAGAPTSDDCNKPDELNNKAGRGMMADTLPEVVLRPLGLPGFAEAIHLLHHPPPELPQALLESRSHPAWRRMQFDELLAQQLSLRQAYTARRARGAPALKASGERTGALLRSLPFSLTGAQQRAWHEIASDLAAPFPMQRLLQGDVGSGKTIVAALAMLHAVEAGHQAALMAPTEILAEQHARKLIDWLTPLGLEVAWLSGSMKRREREQAVQGIVSGKARVVVGTHALIEDKVGFARLGLAIVDEQHRFGVRQRLALKEKGQSAHQLTMSATPIPRTLAMSYYADMDVSVLDELPPGRTPVTTKLVSEARRDEVVGRVHEACMTGRQVYWVCPLIEESEALQLKTAEETHARLSADLPDVRVGLVHGRLKPAEKAAVMEAFVRNEVQLLVATTVIEVGVDVPNASLMVIEHAERFGLAQLHQLRGRVGRGAAASACVLLYASPLGETARARLRIIYENNDGFEIAREDLRLRGPGEFIGARQSGLPLLRYADLDDAATVERARNAAEMLLRDYPERAEAHLKRWLGGREDLLKA